MKLSKQALAFFLVLMFSVSIWACGETTTTQTGEREGTTTEERAGAPATTPGTETEPGATGQAMDGTGTSPETEPGGETAQTGPGTGTDTATQ